MHWSWYRIFVVWQVPHAHHYTLCPYRVPFLTCLMGPHIIISITLIQCLVNHVVLLSSLLHRVLAVYATTTLIFHLHFVLLQPCSLLAYSHQAYLEMVEYQKSLHLVYSKALINLILELATYTKSVLWIIAYYSWDQQFCRRKLWCCKRTFHLHIHKQARY